MEKKVVKQHVKGQRHPGKTNWKKVISSANHPKIDDENPELVGKKQFKKAANKHG
jgi:hypothetical protein